jgi:hypothetical protein
MQKNKESNELTVSDVKKENKRADGLTMSFSDIKNLKNDFNKRLIGRKTHKEFTIDGVTVTALNEKNAIRKIEKLTKINKK